ncbi:MAG: response regulator [Nitrospirae bacterium]|nr:response regulator [Nitrospirota bacterium]
MASLMPEPHRLLLVDDEENILRALYRSLRKEGYEILMTTDPLEGLGLLREKAVSLILSDYRMPAMDGVKFLREAQAIHPDSIRIILSGYAEGGAVISAINEGGVYKFLTKPWEDDQLRVEIRRALERYDLARNNQGLLEEIRRQNEELVQLNRRLHENMAALQESVVRTIETLSLLPVLKDPHLTGHPDGVSVFCRRVGERLGLGPEDLRDLETAAKLHDIGNIAVDSSVLNKPGPLTHVERTEVERHVVLADEVLRPLMGFERIRRIIRHHHERFDGGGYPDGLKGDDIPLLSRIIYLSDVYDSLMSPRPVEDGILSPSNDSSCR